MTCADFATLTDRDPRDVSRAERAGVTAHYQTCASCRRRMDDAYAEALRELPKLTGVPAAVIEAVTAMEMDPITDADWDDPEVRETLKPKPE